MNVILTTNVSNLGSLGDEVRVKDGYARNFLIPRGLALSADSRNASTLAHQRRVLEAKRKEAVGAAQATADKVRAMELVLMAKAGPSGRLFGAVNNRNLQDLLAENGVTLDRRDIVFNNQVKSLGTYTATLKFHSEVKVNVSFKVVPSAEEKAAAEEAAAAASTEAPANEA